MSPIEVQTDAGGNPTLVLPVTPDARRDDLDIYHIAESDLNRGDVSERLRNAGLLYVGLVDLDGRVLAYGRPSPMTEERDAIQESGAAQVHARQAPGDGEAVGGGDAEGSEAAGTRDDARPEAKPAAKGQGPTVKPRRSR
jgi:hypothetical protein